MYTLYRVSKIEYKSISPHSRKRQCFLLQVGSLTCDFWLETKRPDTKFQRPRACTYQSNIEQKASATKLIIAVICFLYITFICLIFQITDNIFTVLRCQKTRIFIKQTRTSGRESIYFFRFRI